MFQSTLSLSVFEDHKCRNFKWIPFLVTTNSITFALSYFINQQIKLYGNTYQNPLNINVSFDKKKQSRILFLFKINTYFYQSFFFKLKRKFIFFCLTLSKWIQKVSVENDILSCFIAKKIIHFNKWTHSHLLNFFFVI